MLNKTSVYCWFYKISKLLIINSVGEFSELTSCAFLSSSLTIFVYVSLFNNLAVSVCLSNNLTICVCLSSNLVTNVSSNLCTPIFVYVSTKLS